jgi:alkylation response protein AidB-like acyl-CoA dehydrogenase
VNFDLGPDELALRDGVRDVCAKRFQIERVREGFDRSMWRELGEAGVFSLRLSEDDGGVGLGMTEAAIVFQELGRYLVPGPLVATHLAAGFVDGAKTGERIVGLIQDQLVEHFAILDELVVLNGSVRAIDRAALHGEELSPLDPLTPVSRVNVPSDGKDLDVDPVRLLDEATLLTAALLAGIAVETTERAVAYARERVQFDRPIGSFQAVKHICADMLVRAEVARAAVDAAAVMFDDADSEPSGMLAAAKLLGAEAAMTNAKACIQVHGGMGFTWEVDAHLYLKRAAVLASQFGGIDRQAEIIASGL